MPGGTPPPCGHGWRSTATSSSASCSTRSWWVEIGRIGAADAPAGRVDRERAGSPVGAAAASRQGGADAGRVRRPRLPPDRGRPRLQQARLRRPAPRSDGPAARARRTLLPPQVPEDRLSGLDGPSSAGQRGPQGLPGRTGHVHHLGAARRRSRVAGRAGRPPGQPTDQPCALPAAQPARTGVGDDRLRGRRRPGLPLPHHPCGPTRTGSTGCRISAEYRWQLADQPVPRRVAIGPFGQEIGSRLFSRTNWWRPVVEGLTLFDDGGEGAQPRLPAPPSRFVSFTN